MTKRILFAGNNPKGFEVSEDFYLGWQAGFKCRTENKSGSFECPEASSKSFVAGFHEGIISAGMERFIKENTRKGRK